MMRFATETSLGARPDRYRDGHLLQLAGSGGVCEGEQRVRVWGMQALAGEKLLLNLIKDATGKDITYTQ